MTAVAMPRPEPRPWLAALLWLAVLTPFFFLTYGFANWVTGLRQNVPSLSFAWERRIPFLPWTIFPYWTTDLFYAGSLLLCRTRRELNMQVKRLVAVQVFCVAGFLLVPLRFGFDRPHPGGFFGDLFDALMSFDRPFNQAPSLHVALTAVLWSAYARHLSGGLWLAVRAWFVMMALSTLTTWQHHFIDVPAGLWAGLFVIWLFPGNPAAQALPPVADPRRFRLAAIYLAGAALAVLSAWWIGGAAWLLLWPAASLAVVAGIYCSGRPELFHKSGGAMPPAVLGLLGPYIAAAWLNSRWYPRREPMAQEIAAGVWIGRIPSRKERQALGIHSLVGLTAELPLNTVGAAYRAVPMLDLLTPTVEQLDRAVDAVRELAPHRPTLVCCALGYSRSAAAVAAWLVESNRAPAIDQAIATIRARRPSIVLSPACRRRLEEWSHARLAR